jgi:hypothetical protein
MDPATLALIAAGLVAKQALEAAGDEAGRSGMQAMGRMARTIRDWLANNDEATEIIDRLEAKPDSQQQIAELAGVLQQRLDTEPTLVAELTRLVEAVKVDPQTASFFATVQGNARVDRLTTIGNLHVHLPSQTSSTYDVYLSSENLGSNDKPTRDSALAAELYKFLSTRGLHVAYSPMSERLSEPVHKERIGDALDCAHLLLAVVTSPDSLNSHWVRYECDKFLEDIRTGRKPGGKLFIYIEGMEPTALPEALRQNRTFIHGPGSFEDLFHALESNTELEPRKARTSSKERRVIESILRQGKFLERWRLFRFEREILINDIYVQEQLRQEQPRSPLDMVSRWNTSPPIHEQAVLAWVCGDVPSENRVCIITGGAGAGKSTLLRNWAIQLIQRHGQSVVNRPSPVPIYLSLRYFSEDSQGRDDKVGAEELASCLARTTPVLPWDVAEYPFRSVENVPEAVPTQREQQQGDALNWIVFLDGLDEMPPRSRLRLWRWAEFVPSSVRVVLATRPGIAEALPPMPRSARYEVCNFNEDQIGRFVDQWFRSDERLAVSFKKQVDANIQLRRLAVIPLLLTCLSMDVEIRGSPQFPDNLIESDVLKRAVEIMLDRWDAAREGRAVDSDRIRLGKHVFTRIALNHGFGEVFPYSTLASQVAASIKELELSPRLYKAFLKQATSSATVITGDQDYGYSFAHAVFFDFFFARGIEEGLLR